MMERSFKFQVSGFRLSEFGHRAVRLRRANLKLETRNPKRAGSARAFNLVELMFSILILGVGLVAVASLFPVASSLQQETMDDVVAAQVWSNARFLLEKRRIPPNIFTASNPAPPQDGSVFYWAGLPSYWPAQDRTHPSGTNQFSWVPLFRRDNDYDAASPQAWETYVFIVKGPELADNVVTLDPFPAMAGDFYVDRRTPAQMSAASPPGGPPLLRIDRFREDVTNWAAPPWNGAVPWHASPNGRTSSAKYVGMLDGGVVRP